MRSGSPWVLAVALVASIARAAVAGPALLFRLEPTFRAVEDHLGISLAMVGGEILVGSLLEDTPGAAWVFDTRTGAVKLTLQRPVVGEPQYDYFGYRVAATRRLLVASSLDGVHVFDRSGRLLKTIPVPEPASGFGSTLAAQGPRIAIGSGWGNDRAAWLLDWRTQVMRRFDDPTGDPDAGFGSKVALLGHRLIVSAPGIGTVYAFDGRTGELLWTSQVPETTPGDGFGASLTPCGSRLFVGAPGDDGDGPDTGAVYVLDGATGAVRGRYAHPTGVGGEGFGVSVAARGDAVLVGAPYMDAGEAQAGGAYLLAARTASLLDTFIPVPEEADANAGLSAVLTADRVIVGGYDWSGFGTVSVYAR